MSSAETAYFAEDEAPVRRSLERLLRASGLQVFKLQEVLSARGERWQVVALKAGGVDLPLRPANEPQLVDAVRRALDRAARSDEEAAALDSARSRMAALTPRERQVMHFVLCGRLNKQIAADLGTAEKTVKIQRAGMMKKLGVRSVAELVWLAARMQIEPPEAFRSAAA